MTEKTEIICPVQQLSGGNSENFRALMVNTLVVATFSIHQRIMQFGLATIYRVPALWQVVCQGLVYLGEKDR